MTKHRIPSLAIAAALTLTTSAIAQEKKPTTAPAKTTEPATEAAPAEKLPPEVLATVDGEKIMGEEILAELGKQMAARRMPPDGLPAEQKQMIVRQMVDNKISEILITRASKDIAVTDKDIEEEVGKLKEQLQDGDDGVEKFARSRGMSTGQLKDMIGKHLHQRKWMEKAIEGKFTPLTDAEAKDFFEKNPQHFQMPEQVRASHILFRVDADATPDKVEEVKKKATAAIERTKKEDFAKLAGELSEEPGAKERGGDLNFFPRQGVMVEEFAAEAFKLKTGDITAAPVRTQFGFHIIKVTERKEGKKNTFEEAKPLIKQNLEQSRKNEAVQLVLQDIRSKAKVVMNLPEPPPAPKPAIPQGAAPAPKPAADRKPVEAVTPPVSAPPVEKK